MSSILLSQGGTAGGQAGTVQTSVASTDPTLAYRAAVNARSELRNQLSRLEDRRGELTKRLNRTENPISAADRAGVEKALLQVDDQIAAVSKDLAAAEARVAQAAAVPGTSTEIPRVPNNDPPPTLIIGSTLTFFLALPVVIAYSRRIWRRADKPTAFQMPSDVSDRLDRLEHAVESVAIEVERVGEGQRFVTQLLAEGPARSLPAAGSVAEPLPIAERSAVRERAKDIR